MKLAYQQVAVTFMASNANIVSQAQKQATGGDNRGLNMFSQVIR